MENKKQIELLEFMLCHFASPDTFQIRLSGKKRNRDLKEVSFDRHGFLTYQPAQRWARITGSVRKKFSTSLKLTHLCHNGKIKFFLLSGNASIKIKERIKQQRDHDDTCEIKDRENLINVPLNFDTDPFKFFSHLITTILQEQDRVLWTCSSCSGVVTGGDVDRNHLHQTAKEYTEMVCQTKNMRKRRTNNNYQIGNNNNNTNINNNNTVIDDNGSDNIIIHNNNNNYETLTNNSQFVSDNDKILEPHWPQTEVIDVLVAEDLHNLYNNIDFVVINVNDNNINHNLFQ